MDTESQTELDQVVAELLTRLAALGSRRALELHQQICAAYTERSALAATLDRARADLAEVKKTVDDLAACLDRTLARAIRLSHRHRPVLAVSSLNEVCGALGQVSEQRDLALGYVAVLEHLDEARGALELDAELVAPEVAARAVRWSAHETEFEKLLVEADSLTTPSVAQPSGGGHEAHPLSQS